MKLWYDHPIPGWQTARESWKPAAGFDPRLENPWFQALPVGNGHLGAMVFGGIGVERLQLNEETLRSGGPMDRRNPLALALLPELRRLLFEGRSAEAGLLLQSHEPASSTNPLERVLSLLPALPPSWPDGRIAGLRARGGFEVDLAWRGGRLTRATIRSALGTRCTLRTGGPVTVRCAGQAVPVEALAPDTVAFATAPGAVYEVRSGVR